MSTNVVDETVIDHNKSNSLKLRWLMTSPNITKLNSTDGTVIKIVDIIYISVYFANTLRGIIDCMTKICGDIASHIEQVSKHLCAE